jgi:hypothetical protein
MQLYAVYGNQNAVGIWTSGNYVQQRLKNYIIINS